MSDDYKSPIELLYELEQHCLRVAKGLPQREDIQVAWTGIGFRVGDLNLAAPLNQVHEVLRFPKMTRIPGTHAWVKGVANVRGTLLTVTDLNQFLGKPPSQSTHRTRILVYRRDELAVGLMVDEVLGLKHFYDEHKVSAVTKFDEALRGYVRGAFKASDIETLVFSMHALAEDPQFFRVAV